MKKVVSLGIALILLLFAACGKSADTSIDSGSSGQTASQAENSSNSIDDSSVSDDNTDGGSIVGEFDFEKKTVMLNSGYEMPMMKVYTRQWRMP